jgi:hypothetical protein
MKVAKEKAAKKLDAIFSAQNCGVGKEEQERRLAAIEGIANSIRSRRSRESRAGL